jgi:hypothetical protein
MSNSEVYAGSVKRMHKKNLSHGHSTKEHILKGFYVIWFRMRFMEMLGRFFISASRICIEMTGKSLSHSLSFSLSLFVSLSFSFSLSLSLFLSLSVSLSLSLSLSLFLESERKIERERDREKERETERTRERETTDNQN